MDLSVIFNIICVVVLAFGGLSVQQQNEVNEAPSTIVDSSLSQSDINIDANAAETVDTSVPGDIDIPENLVAELNTLFEKVQQKLAHPHKNLVVDGDVVQTASTPPNLSFGVPRTDTKLSNVTININGSQEVNATSYRCTCVTGKETGGQHLPVELVNSTRLLNILTIEANVTSRKAPANCVVLMFFSQGCPFSAVAAPHFNALPRAFPDIKMAAVDAMKYHSFNTQYGVVGVPTVMLFHNGWPVAKFNESEYTLELFAKFITKNTGIEADNKLLFVMSADFGGPVSSVPTKELDYCLVASWVFIIFCGVYFFSKSAWWKWIVDTVQNTWREAEAQHEHAE